MALKDLQINSHPKVKDKFQSYPQEIASKLHYLRNLVIETAREIGTIDEIEETLKWGEPSYLVKNGSTIRMDWKLKNPDQYAMYFKCTSKLVSTFRDVFGDTFQYENNRAIFFDKNDVVPDEELKECIRCALMYHSVKHLNRLGL